MGIFKKFSEKLNSACFQAKNHDTLDDSLTSLQWLWNLNVNISNPTDQIDQSNNLHPSFSKNFSDIDKNSASAPQLPVDNNGLSTSPKNLNENCSNHLLQQQVNLANLTVQLTNGAIKALPKSGRKTSVQVIGRPSPPISHTQRYARYSNSTHSGKKLRKGL